jgi:hypothetical protein
MVILRKYATLLTSVLQNMEKKKICQLHEMICLEFTIMKAQENLEGFGLNGTRPVVERDFFKSVSQIPRQEGGR